MALRSAAPISARTLAMIRLHLPTVPENFTNAGGAVDFHIDDAHIEGLFPGRGYTREKFTYQMSDHFPVWIQEDGS